MFPARSFEANKIARLIKVQGASYVFKRDILNEIKEPTGETLDTCINGVFHEQIQHITVTGTDAATVRQKMSSYVLALYADAKDIQQGDYVYVDGRKYLVNGINNISNWDVAVDISLEEVV